MVRFSRRWAWLIIVLTLAFSMGVAACGDDEPETAKDAVDNAADQVGEAADSAADALNVVAGDPAAGATVFSEQGCAGCHSVDSNAAMTGPSLQNIGNVAEDRTDQSAAEYVRESITHPDAYVVEGYQAGVMPAFELPDDQLDNLVAYLLTLRQ